jgi:hypothetical protein
MPEAWWSPDLHDPPLAEPQIRDAPGAGRVKRVDPTIGE